MSSQKHKIIEPRASDADARSADGRTREPAARRSAVRAGPAARPVQRRRRRAVDVRPGHGRHRHAAARWAPVPRTLTVAIEIVGDRRLRRRCSLYVRYATHTPQTKTDVGLCLHGAERGRRRAAQHLGADAVDRRRDADTLSWITIVILVSSMIVPTTPRKMLAASLVAASMDPLGVWVAHLRGVPVPSRRQHVRALHAQLRLRRRGDAAVARPAAARPPAARGAGAGQLPAGRAARPRRHGRGVARRAPAAGAQRGDQAGAARSCSARSNEAEARIDAAPVRARGAGDGGAELAAHDSRVRLRRHRTTARSTT